MLRIASRARACLVGGRCPSSRLGFWSGAATRATRGVLCSLALLLAIAAASRRKFRLFGCLRSASNFGSGTVRQARSVPESLQKVSAAVVQGSRCCCLCVGELFSPVLAVLFCAQRRECRETKGASDPCADLFDICIGPDESSSDNACIWRSCGARLPASKLRAAED